MVGVQVSNKVTFFGAVTTQELLPYTLICDTTAEIKDNQSVPERWALEAPCVTGSYGLHREEKTYDPFVVVTPKGGTDAATYYEVRLCPLADETLCYQIQTIESIESV